MVANGRAYALMGEDSYNVPEKKIIHRMVISAREKNKARGIEC